MPLNGGGEHPRQAEKALELVIRVWPARHGIAGVCTQRAIFPYLPLIRPRAKVATVTGAGTIVIEADQAGNSAYSAAPPIQQSLIVSQASPSDYVGQPAGNYLRHGSHELAARRYG
jgi:hypothetical protein